MPFKAGEVTGRPKGAEGKDTKKLREAIAAITNGGVEDFQRALSDVLEENPAKYLELYLKLLEYTMPKLRSIDTNIELGESTLHKITVEINAGAKDTSNSSIPEELGS
jgi:type II restriction/modification system DNA methylase subunit YeeA